ncbi:hypothetical protein [Brevibacillus centrosporus]|uniref:hypothetical protein n=1 Tax=Brevibacillus centrosporus TaxID=54910 RepID=UPI003B029FE5
MENTLEVLRELIEKQKKSKLTKTENLNVIDLLKKLATIESGMVQLPAILISIPSELGAQTLLEILLDKDEVDKIGLLSTIIKSPEFDNHLGYIRQLEMVKVLMPFPHLAMYLLFDLSEKVTEGCSKQAAPSILKKFGKDLMHEAGVLTLRLDESIRDLQIASLAVIVVGSLVEGQINDELALKVLEWLKTAGRKILVPKPLKRKLENDTKFWDTSLKAKLLQLGLINRLVDTDRLPSEVTTSYLPPTNESGDSVTVTPTQTLVNNEIKSKPSIESDFDKIRNLVNGLEASAKRANEDVLRLKAELMKVENIRAFTQRKLEDTEKSLAIINNQKQELENTNRELSEKLNKLENLLVQKEKEYEKNRHELIDMSEHQTEFRTEVFKNKLRKKLRIEYMDFCEIESDEMTLRLGENMRMQVKNIFFILESEGISFDGGINQ